MSGNVHWFWLIVHFFRLRSSACGLFLVALAV